MIIQAYCMSPTVDTQDVDLQMDNNSNGLKIMNGECLSHLLTQED